MRSLDEEQHESCDNILDEMANCGIIYVSSYDDEDEEAGDLYPGEFAVFNDDCDQDPLILTADELVAFGEQLIRLAKQHMDSEEF